MNGSALGDGTDLSDIEMFLTDLGEVVTRELVKELKPIGLSENKTVDRLGSVLVSSSNHWDLYCLLVLQLHLPH